MTQTVDRMRGGGLPAAELAALRDVLDRTATTMGRTDHLSDEDKDALVAYLLTL